VNPDADERHFRRLVVLTQGGLGLFDGSRLIAEESGDTAWNQAAQRLREGAAFSECVPGLPRTLAPILRWGEQAGLLDEALPAVLDSWPRPLDRRVPFFYLARATRERPLRDALRDAAEFAAIDAQWSTLAAAEDSAAAARRCTALFPAPLGEAVAAAVTQPILPKIFNLLHRGCGAGLLPADPKVDRASSIRQGLYAMSVLMAAGYSLEAAIAATVPAIQHDATRMQFSGLRAERFGTESMDFLSDAARLLIRRAFECGRLDETLEYVATHLVDG